ncbi:ADP-ribosylglycohydrolase family protein [Eubacteriales bacterium mix99]|jgi:ADP-ribosylglycohydrolase
MLGAIIGDIVRSRFKFNNYRSKNFDLLAAGCFVTDDSIMTLAIAKAILACEGDWESFGERAAGFMQEIGHKHPDCGFSSMFNRWIFSDDSKSYYSFGSGVAMHVSPCGFIARTEEEAKLLSRKVAEVTHNHAEGIKGAEAVTIAIFLARSGATKKEIRERIERDYYKLDFTLDGIRDTCQFSETCQETVPRAIVAFLESITFEDAIRNAISIGGDSNTLAAITGAIAEAYYGIPFPLKRKALTYLDDELRGICREWEQATRRGKPNRKFDFITKYIGKLDDRDNWQDFYREFYIFAQLNPEYGLKDYQAILEKQGLKWTEESMKTADVDILDEQTVLALILGAHRAEHFTEGVLETFICEGYITKWLRRLKTIDDKRKPEPDRPVLKQVRVSLQPIRGGSTSELLVTNEQVVIKNSIPEGGSVTHQYEIEAALGIGEDSLSIMEDCLDAEGWQDDARSFSGTSSVFNVYELKAEYEGGKTVVHKGIFDRAHMPEKQFIVFIDAIHAIIRSFGFGGIVGLSGFMSALKKGEVKYCGVEFPDGGKIYHYRTADLRIDIGDEVVVPVGESNYEREATVRTIEFCHWDDTPYPLEKTKEIICLVSDKEEPSVSNLLTGSVGDEEDEDD